jgi:hypothetical protein
MNDKDLLKRQLPVPDLRVSWLEQLVAVILVGVLLALAWILLIAYEPDIARLVSEEVEVILVVALLILALGLVSLVALLHTRSGNNKA